MGWIPAQSRVCCLGFHSIGVAQRPPRWALRQTNAAQRTEKTVVGESPEDVVLAGGYVKRQTSHGQSGPRSDVGRALGMGGAGFEQRGGGGHGLRGRMERGQRGANCVQWGGAQNLKTWWLRYPQSLRRPSTGPWMTQPSLSSSAGRGGNRGGGGTRPMGAMADVWLYPFTVPPISVLLEDYGAGWRTTRPVVPTRVQNGSY